MVVPAVMRFFTIAVLLPTLMFCLQITEAFSTSSPSKPTASSPVFATGSATPYWQNTTGSHIPSLSASNTIARLARKSYIKTQLAKHHIASMNTRIRELDERIHETSRRLIGQVITAGQEVTTPPGWDIDARDWLIFIDMKSEDISQDAQGSRVRSLQLTGVVEYAVGRVRAGIESGDIARATGALQECLNAYTESETIVSLMKLRLRGILAMARQILPGYFDDDENERQLVEVDREVLEEHYRQRLFTAHGLGPVVPEVVPGDLRQNDSRA